MVYSHLRHNRIATVVLILAFLAFIVGIAMVFSMARTGDPFSFALPSLLFAVFYILVSLSFSKSAVLSMSGAHRIAEENAPELFHIVENLAITRGMPLPDLYLIEDSAPNAFATGTSKKHAVIAVTTGLLDKLQKNEIEGVIAHELAHIQHEDTRLMTLVVLLVGVVTLLADFFLRSMAWGRRNRDGGGVGGGKAGAIFLFAGIVLALLSPFIAQFIKLAISRKREFYADAEAALTTRYPEGLALALEKISADQEPLEVANRATSHLYICSPLKGKDAQSLWHTMFSTHPDPVERIRRLREMMT